MNELTVLLISAATIGFTHTLLGPDHYLPFIVMGKARNWGIPKTTIITLLSGLAHVGSSIVIGLIGIAFGLAINGLELFESVRGSIAAWMLIAFGLVYLIWGIRKALQGHPHHHHRASGKKDITPWVLFTVFIFGPCEPLIPLLIYPAARHSTTGVVLVAAVFSIATITTMLSIVLVSLFGLRPIKVPGLEKYGHAFAGGIVLASGLAIHFLGL